MTRRPIAALSLAVLLTAACRDEAPAPRGAPTPQPTPATDAVGEAAKSYRVAALATPPSVAVGERTRISVEIAMTRPDVHVQQEFPLKVSLTSSAGLTLEKATLGHADALHPDAKGRRWELEATARGSGPQEVVAALRFAICKETEPAWCVTRNELLRATVEVR